MSACSCRRRSTAFAASAAWVWPASAAVRLACVAAWTASVAAFTRASRACCSASRRWPSAASASAFALVRCSTSPCSAAIFWAASSAAPLLAPFSSSAFSRASRSASGLPLSWTASELRVGRLVAAGPGRAPPGARPRAGRGCRGGRRDPPARPAPGAGGLPVRRAGGPAGAGLVQRLLGGRFRGGDPLVEGRQRRRAGRARRGACRGPRSGRRASGRGRSGADPGPIPAFSAPNSRPAPITPPSRPAAASDPNPARAPTAGAGRGLRALGNRRRRRSSDRSLRRLLPGVLARRPCADPPRPRRPAASGMRLAFRSMIGPAVTALAAAGPPRPPGRCRPGGRRSAGPAPGCRASAARS